MNRSPYSPKTGRFPRMLIWTIRHQDSIAHHIRIYIWSATAILLLLTLSQRIPLELALYVLLFCGIFFGFGLWVAIERRRSWLLAITDPDLKQEVYNAMLAYIARKTNDRKKYHSIYSQEELHRMESQEKSYIH